MSTVEKSRPETDEPAPRLRYPIGNKKSQPALPSGGPGG